MNRSEINGLWRLIAGVMAVLLVVAASLIGLVAQGVPLP